MNAKQLIEELQKLPEDTIMYVWVHSERLEVTEVDNSFFDDGYADINTRSRP
jgi:hypothetical protein